MAELVNAPGNSVHERRMKALLLEALRRRRLLRPGGAEYQVSEGLDLFVSGKVDKVFRGRSDTELFDIPTGTYLAGETDASGADLLSGVLKVGLKGSF